MFDTTWTNVAFLKNTTCSQQYTSATVNFYCSMGVDGNIEFDAANGNLVASLNGVAEWWTVDLGAMYNVSCVGDVPVMHNATRNAYYNATSNSAYAPNRR